jgi:hypothetical protein
MGHGKRPLQLPSAERLLDTGATVTEKMPFAEVERKWKELVRLLREREGARDAFYPFREGWTPAERLAEWNRINEDVEEVQRLMDDFIQSM